ncbi:hypothetical protein RP20_CCG018631 [Aedes albopictus]|nr:hypothetical protein RP20_CCG018631 [Aedes albopictus]
MLKEENIHPEEMAIDRPSEKLLGFLQKHYGLYKKIPQMNNFVVYEGFFANNHHASDIDGRRMHITASPNTNLFGPTFTTVGDQRRSSSQTRQPVVSPPVVQQPPVGRYAAKRPSCSMAQEADPEPEPGSNGDGVAEEVLTANLRNLSMSEPTSDYIDYHPNHHHQLQQQQQHQQQVKFADDYADIPEPEADPDPYSFHPHHLELSPQQQSHHQDMMTNRENSASPQSISQQQTPEHPGFKKPIRYTKQHTGLKNMSSGVGAAVMPSGKMEFDQEENEGFGSVKINRPIGKSGTRNSLSGDNDNESVHSKGSDSSHLTDHGHFDLKFYHNKLW